ncbi:hypothetical protein PR048_030554, partial [Dryococelus australis]
MRGNVDPKEGCTKSAQPGTVPTGKHLPLFVQRSRAIQCAIGDSESSLLGIRRSREARVNTRAIGPSLTCNQRSRPQTRRFTFHVAHTYTPLHPLLGYHGIYFVPHSVGAAVARVASLLASHRGEPGSIPGRATSGFSHVRIVPDDAAGRRVFSGISHFFALSFRRCSIHTSITLIGYCDLAVKRAAQNLFTHILHIPAKREINISMGQITLAKLREDGAAPECKDWRETGDPRENPSTSGIVLHDPLALTIREQPLLEVNLVRLVGRVIMENQPLDIATQNVRAPLAYEIYTTYPLQSTEHRNAGLHELRVSSPPPPSSRMRYSSRIVHRVNRPKLPRTDQRRILESSTSFAHLAFVGRVGATVAEWLYCSPPTKANRVKSPAGSLHDFRMRESCRTMLLVSGFSRRSPRFPHPCIRGAAPFSPHFTVIGSQDPAAKGSPKLFTHLTRIARKAVQCWDTEFGRRASWTSTLPLRSFHDEEADDAAWDRAVIAVIHGAQWKEQVPHITAVNKICPDKPVDLWLLQLMYGPGRTSLRHNYTVSLLASHQGEPGSIPGQVTPGFSRVGIVPDDAAGPAPSFRHCSMLTSITLIGSQDLDDDIATCIKCAIVARRKAPELACSVLVALLVPTELLAFKSGMELRVQGQEARERYGRHYHARLMPHRSYAQGVQCFRLYA